MVDGLCPCGRPLHYSDVGTAAYVISMIKQLGPNILVRRMGAPGGYLVPRHWIALHGIHRADELEGLAEDYGWEYVPDVPEEK